MSNSSLIKKVYFPAFGDSNFESIVSSHGFRIGIRSTVGNVFLTTAFTLRSGYCGYLYSLLLAMVTALGAALWLSAMNVSFRDIEQALPFLIQVWLFATPIAYPSSLLSPRWRNIVRNQSDGGSG